MKPFLTTLLLAVAVYSTSAQEISQIPTTREQYISLTAPLAIEHQQFFGIPASITIAQGILETGVGNKSLTDDDTKLIRIANNHFGIKQGGTSRWPWDIILINDDKPNESFRMYRSIEDSFIDHSYFLKNRRYESLFDLDIHDYKGWANGLYACGYALNTKYGADLIAIIEQYGLMRLDNGVIPIEYQLITTNPPYTLVEKYASIRPAIHVKPEPLNYNPIVANTAATNNTTNTNSTNSTTNTTVATTVQSAPPRPNQPPQPQIINTDDGLLHYQVERINGRRYIVAKRGDTYAVLARMLGISEQTLRSYNNSEIPLRENDKVFLGR